MLEIMAVIRPEKLADTKAALEKAGFPSYTCRRVMGRGAHPVSFSPDPAAQSMVPKRLFMMMVHADEVETAIRAILDVNSTGHAGDGKIFVLPVTETYYVRDGAGGPEE
jgi:nitrogen regulatory protein PII 2